jgi:DNA-binding SARP family transcriptional activator/tetratricopeptide (TPR) repeat protein
MSANAQEFRVLGPVEIMVDGRSAAIGAAKPRTLLALLLLDANRPVERDRLIEQLWGEDPPKAAEATLRSYVYQLRKRLPRTGSGTALHSRNKGYVLETAAGTVDAQRFEALAKAGRQALQRNRFDEGIAALREGLGLWPGPAAFADIDAAAVRDKARLIDDLRLDVVEQCLAAELETGSPVATVAELEALTLGHPLREGFWRLLMLGLYGAGRQAEALAAYQRLYKLLDAELGIKPSPPIEELHRQILRYDPRLPSAPATATASPRPRPTMPRQLPSSAAHFTGREAQLSSLDELLAAPADAAGAASAAIITGAAGIGKTALAVHWAHRVADRFPDGQLYVNLRGFDPVGQPVEPGEAVRHLLESLRTPPTRIPRDLDAQAALYRSLLAGKRVLVVLDNARDLDQVRPLLPGTAASLALVTSRNSLSGLIAHGAVPLTLTGLDAEEAARFLAHRLRGGRTAAEPEAAERIIEACDGLPLALAIVAARAAARPDFSLTALAASLADAHDRLDALADPDPAVDLRTVLSWSYRALTADAARLFRLLSAHPGPEITAAAAAAVAGLAAQQANRLLVELSRGHLLNEPAPGRFAFHDLLRAYSAELAETVETEQERREATRRLLDFYLHTAYAASRLTDPNRDPIPLADTPADITPLRLADGETAMAWFASEGAALATAVQSAAEQRFDTHCWQLAWTLRDHLDRGPWQAQTAVWQTALEAARRLDDAEAEVRVSRPLAMAYHQIGRTDDARALLGRTLVLCRDLGDRVGEAHAHLIQGRFWERQERFDEAIDCARRALELYRDSDHHEGQGSALNAIGWYHSMTGDHRTALAYCEEAMKLMASIGDRHGQATAADSLGYAHHHLGRHTQAIAFYEHALALYRDLGSRTGEADTVVNLGDAQHAIGDIEAAQRTWRRALAIFDHLGHPDAAKVRARLAPLAPRSTAEARVRPDPGFGDSAPLHAGVHDGERLRLGLRGGVRSGRRQGAHDRVGALAGQQLLDALVGLLFGGGGERRRGLHGAFGFAVAEDAVVVRDLRALTETEPQRRSVLAVLVAEGGLPADGHDVLVADLHAGELRERQFHGVGGVAVGEVPSEGRVVPARGGGSRCALPRPEHVLDRERDGPADDAFAAFDLLRARRDARLGHRLDDDDVVGVGDPVGGRDAREVVGALAQQHFLGRGGRSVGVRCRGGQRREGDAGDGGDRDDAGGGRDTGARDHGSSSVGGVDVLDVVRPESVPGAGRRPHAPESRVAVAALRR